MATRTAVLLSPGIRILSAFCLCALAAAVLFCFPVGRVWLIPGFVIYVLILWFFPTWWLFFIPALLPVLDLAQWSGWLMVNLFDALVLVTLATLLIRRPPGRSPPLSIYWRLLLVFLALSYLVSFLLGLFPLNGPDAGSFYSYHSSWNSLRLLKGFLAALLLFPWLRREAAEAPERLKGLLAAGLLTGLAGVVLCALHERFVFAGLFDFSDPFRIHSTFSAMHIGGAPLDAFLVLVLPFSLYLCKQGSRLRPAIAFLLLILGCYTLVVTFSRIVYFAAGLEIILLSAGLLYLSRFRAKKTILMLPVLVLVILAGWAALSAPFVKHRFERLAGDFASRAVHWQRSLAATDDSLITTIWGKGLGAFPREYQEEMPQGKNPARFVFESDGKDSIVRLPSGGNMYLGQRVALNAGQQYEVLLTVRSRDSDSVISVPVCEKNLQYSYSCAWLSKPVGDTGGKWRNLRFSFDGDRFNQGEGFFKRPVRLSLYNGRKGTTVEVGEVRLLDSSGDNIIRNGDFERAGAHWFFTSDAHNPWHAMNIWVHLFFEQGLVGVAGFGLLLISSGVVLVRRVWRGRDLFALLLLSGLAGVMVVGLVDSVLDNPRIGFLVYFLMVAAVGLYGNRPSPQPLSPSPQPLSQRERG